MRGTSACSSLEQLFHILCSHLIWKYWLEQLRHIIEESEGTYLYLNDLCLIFILVKI